MTAIYRKGCDDAHLCIIKSAIHAIAPIWMPAVYQLEPKGFGQHVKGDNLAKAHG